MKIIIVGASGFGKEIASLLSRIPEYELFGFVDDNYSMLPEFILGKPVLGPISKLLSYNFEINIAIGIANPKLKKIICTKLLENSNLVFPNLIDPKALIGVDVKLGTGNVLMANTTYTADITIGDFNMINIGSTVGHDVSLGNYNAIFPSVNISGNVTIENENEIGVGTKIIQDIHIGNSNVIGAGTVVIRNIENQTKSIGIPARIIERWD